MFIWIGRKFRDKKSWVLKGLDSQHVRGYCHPSKDQFALPPMSTPLSLAVAFGSKQGGGFVQAPPLTSWGSHCLPGSSGSPVSPGKCFSGKWGRRRRRGGRRRTRSPKRCEFSRQPQDWASQTWNAQKVKLKQTNTLHKRRSFWSEHRKTLRNTWAMKTVTGNLWCYCSKDSGAGGGGIQVWSKCCK